MNSDLKQAIENYCSMLPYANKSPQPNDDKRLYTISYFLVKTEEPFDIDFFKQELRKNSQSGLNILVENQFEKFANNRIEAIKKGKYVIDRISELVFA